MISTIQPERVVVGGKPDNSTDLNRAILAPGAPIEEVNPLGHEITIFSAVMLNVGQLLGSGIWSISGTVLQSAGSIGLLFALWIIAPLIAVAGLLLFTELAGMFPNRSGAEAVYLEQAYPRPKYLVSSTFAVTAVLLSLSAANAIVFSQYVLTVFNVPITSTSQTALAIGVCTFAILAVGLSTKWSLRAVNFLSALKVLSLGFVLATGIAVLVGATRVTKPFANFHKPFEGSTTNLNSLSVSLVKVNYAFVGWHNAFYVLGEVKSKSPVHTIRKAGFISLGTVAFLCFFTNVAYVAAVPREEMRNSGQLIAALFFRHAFGDTWLARLLPVMVALSCLGNIMAVTVGQARLLREIARQGLLPYPSFFASTKPFGTPLTSIALKYSLTIIVLLAVPAKDAFNFIMDLSSYPFLIFRLALAFGVLILRSRRALVGLPRSPFQAGNLVILVNALSSAFLLAMPWVPPERNGSDVSFWYATYCVVGIGILALSGVYYWVWFVLLPRLGGYEITMEVEELSDGARNTRLIRKYWQSSEQQPLIIDTR